MARQEMDSFSSLETLEDSLMIKTTHKEYIQKGDYKVGDRVRILFKDDRCYGEIGEVISIDEWDSQSYHPSVVVKCKKGVRSFGYKSSLELIERNWRIA